MPTQKQKHVKPKRRSSRNQTKSKSTSKSPTRPVVYVFPDRRRLRRSNRPDLLRELVTKCYINNSKITRDLYHFNEKTCNTALNYFVKSGMILNAAIKGNCGPETVVSLHMVVREGILRLKGVNGFTDFAKDISNFHDAYVEACQLAENDDHEPAEFHDIDDLIKSKRDWFTKINSVTDKKFNDVAAGSDYYERIYKWKLKDQYLEGSPKETITNNTQIDSDFDESNDEAEQPVRKKKPKKKTTKNSDKHENNEINASTDNHQNTNINNNNSTNEEDNLLDEILTNDDDNDEIMTGDTTEGAQRDESLEMDPSKWNDIPDLDMNQLIGEVLDSKFDDSSTEEEKLDIAWQKVKMKIFTESRYCKKKNKKVYYEIFKRKMQSVLKFRLSLLQLLCKAHNMKCDSKAMDILMPKFNAYNHQMAQILVTYLAYHQLRPKADDFIMLLGIKDQSNADRNILKAQRESFVFLIKKGYIEKDTHKRVKAYTGSTLDRLPFELYKIYKNKNTNVHSFKDKSKGLSVIGHKRFFNQLDADKINEESTDWGDQSSTNESSTKNTTKHKNKNKIKHKKNSNNGTKNYRNLVSDESDDDTGTEPPNKKRKLNDEFQEFRDEILSAISKNNDKSKNNFDRIEKLVTSNINDGNLTSPSKHSVDALKNNIDRGNERFNGEYIVHSKNKIFKLIHQNLVKESMSDGKDKLIEDLLNDTNKGAVATVQGK